MINTAVGNVYPSAALVATGLAAHGYRKGSLSGSGAVAAWVAGYAHLAGPVKLFGVTMIVFYLAGSQATKVKASVKASFEDGPDPSKPGGNRDWIQVLSNSLPGAVAALAYRYHYENSPSPSLVAPGLARCLLFALLGHYATCLADTLASELGILSPVRPVHILTLKTVPPGTNGGVTTRGLVASAAGGAFMGAVVALGLCLEDPRASVSVASKGLWHAMKATACWSLRTGWRGPMGIVAFGTAAGLLGSLVGYSSHLSVFKLTLLYALVYIYNMSLQLDSLLGATLQRTLYSTKDGRVLTDHSSPERATAAGVIPVGPGLDILSNSGVNLICASSMAAVGYWIGGW